MARTILQTADEDLETNARKLKHLFPIDLAQAADAGTLGTNLDETLRGVRRIWMADVREQERVNKQIGIQADRSPNIGLDLLSARLDIKHYLGSALSPVDGRAVTQNWSATRPIATCLMQTCLRHADGIKDVLHDAKRWCAPVADATLLVPGPNEVEQFLRQNPCYRFNQSQMCAAPYNVIWFKSARTAGVDTCWCLSHRIQPDTVVYILAERVHSTGRMVRAKVLDADTIEIMVPLEHITSVNMIAAACDELYCLRRPKTRIPLRAIQLSFNFQGTPYVTTRASIVSRPKHICFLTRPRPRVHRVQGGGPRACASSAAASSSSSGGGGAPSASGSSAASHPAGSSSDVPGSNGSPQISAVEDLDRLAQQLEEILEQDGDVGFAEDVMSTDDVRRLTAMLNSDGIHDVDFDNTDHDAATSSDSTVADAAGAPDGANEIAHVKQETPSVTCKQELPAHTRLFIDANSALTIGQQTPEDVELEALRNRHASLGNLGHLPCMPDGVVPTGALDDASVDSAITAWHTAIKKGIATLKSVAEARTVTPTNRNVLSLVSRPGGSDTDSHLPPQPDVVLVSWSDYDARTGRITDIDEYNCLVCMVPWRSALKQFTGCNIIYPSIDISGWHRRARHDRPRMPELIQRVKQMWEASQTSSTTAGTFLSGATTTTDTCRLCGLDTEVVYT